MLSCWTVRRRSTVGCRSIELVYKAILSLKGETNKGGGLGISSGWWYTYPSEKYEFVSWAYYYSQYMESQKIHVPNHQPACIIIDLLFLNGGAVYWSTNQWEKEIDVIGFTKRQTSKETNKQNCQWPLTSGIYIVHATPMSCAKWTKCKTPMSSVKCIEKIYDLICSVTFRSYIFSPNLGKTYMIWLPKSIWVEKNRSNFSPVFVGMT